MASHVLNRRIRVLHAVGGHILDFAPRTTTGNPFIFFITYIFIIYNLYIHNFSEHDNFSPLHLLYYEEAHFGHGSHYQSIQPSVQVEQSSSEPVEDSADDIGLSNIHVELPIPSFENSTSIIPPSNQDMEPEYVTLGQLEIEENVVGSSTISYSAPEPIPEHNIEGLRPTTEMPKQPTFDTSIGPISLNFDESSCLEPDQIPQTVSRSLRSLPDDSQLPPPPVASGSIMKKNEKKQVKRKYSCDEPDCQKSYTQSHNLKNHKKNKHNLN